MLYPGKAYEELDVLPGDSIILENIKETLTVIEPEDVDYLCLVNRLTAPMYASPDEQIYVIDYRGRSISAITLNSFQDYMGISIHRRSRQEKVKEEPKIQFLIGIED